MWKIQRLLRQLSLTSLIVFLLLLPSASALGTGATSTAVGFHPQHHHVLSALSSWTGILNVCACASVLVLLLLLRSALGQTKPGSVTPLSGATLVVLSVFGVWARNPLAFATPAAAFTQWQHLDPWHVALPVLIITTASSASIALWFRALSGRLSGAGYPPPPDAHDVSFLAWAMEFFQSPAVTASQRPTPSEALESGALNFFSQFLQGTVNPVGSLTADHAWGISRRLAAATRALLVARRLQERYHQTLADIAALLPTGRQRVNFFDLPACLQPALSEFVQLKKDLLTTTSAATIPAALATFAERLNTSSIISVITGHALRAPVSISEFVQLLDEQLTKLAALAKDLTRLTGTTKTAEAIQDLTTLTSAGWTFQQLLALLPSLHKAWEALTELPPVTTQHVSPCPSASQPTPPLKPPSSRSKDCVRPSPPPLTPPDLNKNKLRFQNSSVTPTKPHTTTGLPHWNESSWSTTCPSPLLAASPHTSSVSSPTPLHESPPPSPSTLSPKSSLTLGP
ncbi:hypothetical protein BDD12DRAFT_808747 [Trichophaea hybrida]|nr:hypothetical protein BDD12DRAFT_808747 [Trichophaea hybrida]